MPLTIKEIDGRNDYFSEGDAIISIGGIEVDDQLDVFYLTAGEGSAEFVVRKKDGSTSSRKLRLSDFNDYGISYEEMIEMEVIRASVSPVAAFEGIATMTVDGMVKKATTDRSGGKPRGKVRELLLEAAGVPPYLLMMRMPS